MLIDLRISLVSLLIAGLAPTASQSAPKDETQVQTYSETEAYEVYSVLLPNEWTWRSADSKTLLIKAETVTYRMCLTPDAESEKLLGPAIANFRAVNARIWRLDRKFQISRPYELISKDVLQAPFKNKGPGGWSEFKLQHPDSVGWIELSAVGFSDDKTIAVVYIGHHCGRLCGGGGFSVLRKSEGRWKTLHWGGGGCAWFS